MPHADDPFKPLDATTVIRPRPGAGKRAPVDRPTLSPAPAAAAGPPPPRSYAAPVPAPARAILGSGLNPLVRAATPLLLMSGQVRGMLAAPDVGTLRRHIIEEMRRFEENARAAGVAKEVTLAARYALCAALDEAVLSTPWGSHSEWQQQTLLVALHREAWGGEKFFEMLNRMSADPERHIDLIELQYLCVAFGFAGKYQVREGGHARLAEIQRDVYRLIRSHRGTPPTELSLRWRGVEDRRNPLIRYVPWWVVGAAALGVLAIAFTIFSTSLGRAAGPVQEQLARIGNEDFAVPAAPAPVAGPSLKRLLAGEEAARRVSVEETGAHTVITLTAPDLFPSGSATINASYAATLNEIASAISQVPGRVMVKGHTDDVPIRSLRYRDNFELSRDRARNVAQALAARLPGTARIESNGLGPTEQKFTPASGPDYRARNRRVEIVHVKEL